MQTLVIAFIAFLIAFRVMQTRNQRRNLTYINTTAVSGAVPPSGYNNGTPSYYPGGPPQYYPQPGYGGPQYPPQTYTSQSYSGQNPYYSVSFHAPTLPIHVSSLIIDTARE